LRDLILSTVATVIEPIDKSINLDEQTFVGVLKRPLTIAPAVLGPIVVSSRRDDIELHFSPTKVNVRHLGAVSGITDKVPNLVHFCLDLLGKPKVTSYGINFQYEIEGIDAGDWSRDNLANQTSVRASGLTLESVDSTLRFDVGSKRWNVKFQLDQIGTSLLVDFNATQPSDIPSENDLTSEINEQHDLLIAFLDSFRLPN